MALFVFNVFSSDATAVKRKLDYIIHRLRELENTMTQAADDLKAAVAEAKEAVAKEIQQLADAIANGNDNGDTAAINEAVADLRKLVDDLRADDPPTP